MGRVVASASVCFLLAASFLTCRAPLRGIDYGADVDPFRYEQLMEPGDITGDLVHRLLLIGDAGRPLPEDPTLGLVEEWGDAYPERTTALFLGDNVYPSGLQEPTRARGEAILRQLLESTRSFKLFIPGNHDWGYRWNRALADGALENQQRFIDEHSELNAAFMPRDGCPGPVPVELVEAGPALPGGLTLLVLDLHWWFLPEPHRPVCKSIEETTDFVEELRRELALRVDENVIVAAHHPIRSGGEHGGFTRGFWFDLGVSLLYRFYSAQDLIEPGYRAMIKVLSGALAEHPPLAMVGGHDHSLQVIDGGEQARLLIVSGAATKVTRVTSLEGTLFAHAHLGFIALDFYDTGSAEGVLVVRVVETGREGRPIVSFALPLDGEGAEL